MPEYCAGLGWFDGVDAVRERESLGLQIIRDVFDLEPCALSRHGDYTAPQAHAFAAEVGKPYVYGFPAAPPRFNISWYCGALTTPADGSTYLQIPDEAYADNTKFQSALRRLDEFLDNAIDEGQPLVTIYLCHPLMLRNIDWHVYYIYPNGTNVPEELWPLGPQPRLRSPEEVGLAIENFKRLALKISKDPRLNVISMSEVATRFGYQHTEIGTGELAVAAEQAVRTGVIEIRERFTPAEICLGLVESLLAFIQDKNVPHAVPRRPLLGPMEKGPLMPEKWHVRWDEFVLLARHFFEASLTQGYLVHQLHAWGVPVGIGSFYRALADAYLQIMRGSSPATVSFVPFNRYPEEALALGHRFLDIAEGCGNNEAAGRLVSPTLDTGSLCRLARPQTWTLKPAVSGPGD